MPARKIIPLILLTACFLAGCGPTPPPKPKLNALQIQAMQTQEFTANKRKTFDAVMTVLQNEGYTIQAANFNTGFITAKSAAKASRSDAGEMYFTPGFFGGGVAMRPQYESRNKSVTAFITPGKSTNKPNNKPKTTTRVRLNFIAHRTISGNGATSNQDQQILDTTVYKQAFNEIRQQVFVAGDLK